MSKPKRKIKVKLPDGSKTSIQLSVPSSIMSFKDVLDFNEERKTNEYLQHFDAKTFSEVLSKHADEYLDRYDFDMAMTGFVERGNYEDIARRYFSSMLLKDVKDIFYFSGAYQVAKDHHPDNKKFPSIYSIFHELNNDEFLVSGEILRSDGIVIDKISAEHTKKNIKILNEFMKKYIHDITVYESLGKKKKYINYQIGGY